MAHSYSVDSKGNIYKNGQWVDAKNYKYLEQDPYGQQALSAAKKIKSGASGYTGWSTSRGWIGGSTSSSSSKSSGSTTKTIPQYSLDNETKSSTTKQRSNDLVGGLDSYSVPYEQTLRDLLSQFQNAPEWQPLSEEERRSRATNYADLITNPILQALDQRLDRARTSTQNTISQIESKYAGAQDEVNAILEQLSNAALEDAISRGAGQSGVVNWERQKMQEPVMRDFNQMMSEKASQISGLQRDLTTEEQLIEQARQDAMAQRGMLEQQFLADLVDFDRRMSQSSQSGLWGMAMQLAQLVNGANINQQNIMAGMLPWLTLSPDLITQLFGKQY